MMYMWNQISFFEFSQKGPHRNVICIKVIIVTKNNPFFGKEFYDLQINYRTCYKLKVIKVFYCRHQ